MDACRHGPDGPDYLRQALAQSYHAAEVVLRWNMQQLAGVVAQNRRSLGVTQARCAENVLHGRTGPRIRIIGSDHDLTRTAFRHQMPQRLRGEDERSK